MAEYKKETSIVFTGDIGFDRYMDKKWLDDELLSEDILEFFRNGKLGRGVDVIL